MIDVVCPACNRQMQVDSENVGNRVHCKCGCIFRTEDPALQRAVLNEDPPLPTLVEPEREAEGFKGTCAGWRFDWNNWDLGGKVIFISTCVAAASMLISWVDIGIASANGISQGAVLFLALFVYPTWMLFTKRSIHLWGGVACGALGILFAFAYIASKETEVFGRSVNAASGGPYIFLLSRNDSDRTQQSRLGKANREGVDHRSAG